jgi:hypothetical protein
MSEFKGKFNPGYEYLEDNEIRELQLLLDDCWTSLDPVKAKAARQNFPGKIRGVVASCLISEDRARLLFNCLQKNISINYAGGVGKDFQNPVIISIKKAVGDLLKKYPELLG